MCQHQGGTVRQAVNLHMQSGSIGAINPQLLSRRDPVGLWSVGIGQQPMDGNETAEIPAKQRNRRGQEFPSRRLEHLYRETRSCNSVVISDERESPRPPTTMAIGVRPISSFTSVFAPCSSRYFTTSVRPVSATTNNVVCP